MYTIACFGVDSDLLDSIVPNFQSKPLHFAIKFTDYLVNQLHICRLCISSHAKYEWLLSFFLFLSLSLSLTITMSLYQSLYQSLSLSLFQTPSQSLSHSFILLTFL